LLFSTGDSSGRERGIVWVEGVIRAALDDNDSFDELLLSDIH
jgi:hypothetical protein